MTNNNKRNLTREEILRPPGLTSANMLTKVLVPVILVAVLLVPFIPDIKFYYLQVIILVFFFGTLGTAWGIAGGYGGSHSVGHAGFLAIGAYTSTILWLDFGVSPWLGMIVGMAVAGVAALILGYASFRTGLKGDYFTLVTVAFGMVIYELAIGLPEFTRGSQGMPIPFSPDPLNFQFEDRRWYYYIAFVMWFGTLALSYWIRKSRLGLEMLAVRDDEAAAARGGVSVLKSKLTSFTISAVIAAMAGTFWAQFILYVDPTSVAGIDLSIQIVLVAVLGGMNSFLGGTLGAIILIPAQQYFASTLSAFPGADLAMYGLILVLLMLFMPFGILGTLRKNPRWRKVIGW